MMLVSEAKILFSLKDGKPALQLVSVVSPSFILYVSTTEERDSWMQTFNESGGSPNTNIEIQRENFDPPKPVEVFYFLLT